MLDTYDDYSPSNPINQEEDVELTKLEEVQEYNWELVNKIRKARTQIDNLIELAEQFNNTFLANKLKQIKL